MIPVKVSIYNHKMVMITMFVPMKTRPKSQQSTTKNSGKRDPRITNSVEIAKDHSNNTPKPHPRIIFLKYPR